MADKQAALNGAYYGPAVPPTTQRYHRHGGGRGCGGCCCLFSLLLKIILAIVVVLGLAALIFWLVVRPNAVKFHVTDASLSQFNFANNSNNLNYNLSLTLSIRNPNKKMGIYYDQIETSAYYEDQRLETVWLTPFYQGHKNTTVLKTAMEGEKLVLLEADDRSEFSTLAVHGGVYSIDVKLRMEIRFKVGSVRIGKFKPKINCDLKLPLTANGSSISGYTSTKCDFDF